MAHKSCGIIVFHNSRTSKAVCDVYQCWTRESLFGKLVEQRWDKEGRRVARSESGHVPSRPSLSSFPSASSDANISLFLSFFDPPNSSSQLMHPQGWLPQQKLFFPRPMYVSNKLSKSVGTAFSPNRAPEPDSTDLP